MCMGVCRVVALAGSRYLLGLACELMERAESAIESRQRQERIRGRLSCGVGVSVHSPLFFPWCRFEYFWWKIGGGSIRGVSVGACWVRVSRSQITCNARVFRETRALHCTHFWPKMRAMHAFFRKKSCTSRKKKKNRKKKKPKK